MFKNPVTLVAGSYLIVMAIIGIYANRYKLGLVKPKFQAGSCICADASTEFDKKQSCSVVIQVGKRHYQTMWYDTEDNRAIPSLNVDTIESIDSEYAQISCPRNQDGSPAIRVMR